MKYQPWSESPLKKYFVYVKKNFGGKDCWILHSVHRYQEMAVQMKRNLEKLNETIEIVYGKNIIDKPIKSKI